jgi:hypothetical protein
MHFAQHDTFGKNRSGAEHRCEFNADGAPSAWAELTSLVSRMAAAEGNVSLPDALDARRPRPDTCALQTISGQIFTREDGVNYPAPACPLGPKRARRASFGPSRTLLSSATVAARGRIVF